MSDELNGAMTLGDQSEVQQKTLETDKGIEQAQEDAGSPKNLEEEQEETPKTEGEKKKRKPGGWIRKIEKLELENQALRQKYENYQAPKPVTSKQAPDLNDYETYDEYNRATIAWNVQQAIEATKKENEEETKKKELKTRQDNFNKRVQNLDDTYEDYEEVIHDGFSGVKIREDLLEMIQESDVGPQVAYYLAQNADALESINSNKKTPAAIARELIKIEGQVSKAPEVKTSKLPTPIKPLSGTKAKSAPDISNMSTDQYLAWRRANRVKRSN